MEVVGSDRTDAGSITAINVQKCRRTCSRVEIILFL